MRSGILAARRRCLRRHRQRPRRCHPRGGDSCGGSVGGGGQRSWSLNIESAGVPGTFQIASAPNTIVSLNDPEPLPQGEWVHIAGVFRPGEMEFYVDGERRAWQDIGIPDAQFSANGLSVLIGGRHACGNCAWFGAIDEVAIWNRDLSEDEILQVMESESLLDDVQEEEIFLRSDTDGDGNFTLADGIQILERQFSGRQASGSDCEDAGDVDDNGSLTIGDAIWVFNFLFASGADPAAPYPACGADPTPGDGFDCAGYPAASCP